ncbi:MAG: PASTA domain-containing protein, partial [bacterium]|nr:PASTA domain-containing protein [bacterium]
DPLTFSWDFGDLSAGDTGSAASHTFTSEGSYEVSLTVTDGQGGSDTATTQVTVTLPPVIDLEPISIDTGSITVDPQTLAVSGNASVEIFNNGTSEVANSYSIVLFEDSNGNGTFDSSMDTILGSSSAASGPEGNGSLSVSVALSGTVQFPGNLVYAFIDSENTIEETNEENNITHNRSSCESKPEVGSITPRLEWEWTDYSILSIPVVINLNDDNGDGSVDSNDIPDILVSTNNRSKYTIRAMSGDNSGILFEIPGYLARNGCNLAAGDIDNDGLPEIMFINNAETNVLAFENDGTFKWQSANIPIPNHYSSVSIADLDGDGSPEVSVGRVVLNNDGTLKWNGAHNTYGGSWSGQGTNTIADIDLDGDPELIAGNVVYRSDGELFWKTSEAPEGFTAVGNFDDDPEAEVVIVWNTVSLFEHTGELIWSKAIPGGGVAGQPTVADFDNDGKAEISVSNGSNCMVYDDDGSELWSSPINGRSVYTTSSVFDFEGDGIPELVNTDEYYLRVFRGDTGEVLFSEELRVSGMSGLPVIADVDNDNSAEIIVAGNLSTGKGIRVFGAEDGSWVNTRKIWNQHAYSISNVNDDGTIPKRPANNWESFNNYRQNQVSNPFVCKDLSASFLRIDESNYPNWAKITVRVGNGGALHTAHGVNISFYSGTPGEGTLIETIKTPNRIEAGQYDDISFHWPGAVSNRGPVYIAVDDDGTGTGHINETDETNNTISGTFIPPSLYDLAALSLDTSAVSVDPQTLVLSGTADVAITNKGISNISNSYSIVLFEDSNGNETFDSTIDTVLGNSAVAAGPEPKSSLTATVSVSGIAKFAHNRIFAFIDSENGVEETNEENNIVHNKTSCEQKPSVGTFELEEEWSWDIKLTKGALAANLNDDNGDGLVNEKDIPDVIVNEIRYNSDTGHSSRGLLTALSGDGSGELFKKTEKTTFLGYCVTSAIGDIDNDGLPEIVSVHHPVAGTGSPRLIAFKNDGTVKWYGHEISGKNWNHASVVLADLDSDGKTEIIFYGYVFNNDGTLKFKLPDEARRYIPTIADLDRDGYQEIITGNAAYRSNGELYWNNTALKSGTFTSVGNFDDDPFPEIVSVVSGGRGYPVNIYLLEHTGELIWTKESEYNKRGGGNQPTIADFDNDGKAEIGFEGKNFYEVLEADGSNLWHKSINDRSSGYNGATVFDFQGDGIPEVLFIDHNRLYVLNGSDGSITASLSPGTITYGEYPIVVDIDNDGHAEIIAPSSEYRIKVYGDKNNSWMNTGKIWNQDGFHVTNVEGNGTIPRVEVNHWETHNIFNGNVITKTGCVDLSASYLRIDNAAYPASVTVTARIGNSGARQNKDSISIAFYNGDPKNGGTLLGTAQTAEFPEPGKHEDVSIQWENPSLGASTIYASVDDDGSGNGSIDESDENNNIVSSPFIIGNEAPVANAGSGSTVFVNNTVPLNGSGSSDPEGDALSFTWSIQSAPSGSNSAISNPAAATTSFVPDSAGTFVIQLVVNDGFQDSTVDTVSITVSPVISVPNVVGMAETAAGTAITGAELAVGSTSQSYSNSIPAGSVISQNPAAGTTAFRNSEVDIVLSLGVHMATVPSLTGLTSEEANAALSADGLILGSISQEYIDSIPENNIMNQNPAAGTSVIYGSPVDVTVSAGKWDGVDETAPHVSISVTPEKVFIDEEVTITINAWDNAGIVDRHLTINGDPVDLTGDEYSFYPAEAGKYT